MKKLLAILALCLTLGTTAQAQWYLGGSGSLGYNTDGFQFTLIPRAGYEFNDMFAVEAGLGVYTDFNYAYGSADAWFRFTPWHNDIVYIDLLAGGDIFFNDYIGTSDLGIRPQLRFRIHPSVDFSTWVGLFGASYDYFDGWSPTFLATGISCGVAAVYRF
ncbi:MAG: hypothetical protein Q4D14_01780 [Bacteroidales bacterium]|nr:hypothetical protein [Bacteroidales bacterium]